MCRAILALAALPLLGAATPPPIALESWRCEAHGGFIQIFGEIRNTAQKPLTGIVGLVALRAADGHLEASINARPVVDPLKPGETSPIQGGGLERPSMSSCEISFAEAQGGTLPFASKAPLRILLAKK